MRFGRRRKNNPRVRIIPTMAGWALLGAAVMVGVVAINSGLGLLMIMLGAMLGALHVSAVLGRRMLSHVGVHRELPERCRQNERINVSYVLASARGGGASLAIQVEELPPANQAVPSSACGHLSGRERFLVRSEAVPRHRGRLVLRGVRLTTTFPFGLVRSQKVFQQKATLVVWPARGQLKRELLGKGEAQNTSTVPSQRSGGTDEFFGLREYRPGDSTRWIHWRRSAGREMPVVREMSRPRPRTLWVVLDTLLDGRNGRNWTARERAIRMAGTIIEDALAGGFRVGAAWAGSEKCRVIFPAERRGQLHHLLDGLADVDDNDHRGVDEAAAMLSGQWLHQAHVVVISAAEADETDILEGDSLSRLRRDSRNLTIISGRQIGELFQDATLPQAPGQGPSPDDAPIATQAAEIARAGKEAG